MPNIRTLGTNPRLPQPIVTAESQGAGVGRAIQGLAQDIGRVEDLAVRTFTQRQVDKVDAQAEEARAGLAVKEEEFWNQADPDNDLVEGGQSNIDQFVENELDPVIAGIRANAGFTPAAKRRAEKQAADLENTFRRRATLKSIDLAEANAVEQHKRMMRSVTTGVFSDPESWIGAEGRTHESIDARVENEMLDRKRALVLKTAASNEIAMAAANGTIELNAAQALEDLEGGLYDDKIDGEQKRILMNRAQRKVAGETDALRAIAIDDANDKLLRKAQTGAPATGYTRESYVGLGETPLQKHRMGKHWDKSHAVGDERIVTEGMSIPDQENRISDMRVGLPSSENFAQDAAALSVAESVRNQNLQFWGTDAAGWAIAGSETVDEAYRAFLENPTDETYSAYATATEREQERRAPGAVPRLVPADTIRQTQQLVSQLQTEVGPTAVLDHLMAMSKWAGPKRFNKIMGELRAAGAINGSQYVSTLAAEGGNFVLAEDILRASTQTVADIAARPGMSGKRDQLQDQIVTDIEPLRTALDPAPNGPALRQDIEDATLLVAMARSEATGGGDQTREISNILGEIIMDREVYYNGTRIPAEVDVQGVMSGLQELRHIGITEEIAGGQVFAPPSAAGLLPEEASQEFLASLPFSLVPITNADATGVYIIDSADTGRRVFSQDEVGNFRAIELTWDDLIELGAARRLAAAQREITLQFETSVVGSPGLSTAARAKALETAIRAQNQAEDE